MRRYIQISVAGLLVLWALCGSLRAQVPIINASGTCTAGQVPVKNDGGWTCQTPSGGGVPAGLITITLTTCPSGWSEATALDGITLIGTLAAHADVGTTGGSDTLTPSGTVSQPTFAGNALGTHAHGVGTFAASAPTFTGSALGTHSHTSSSLVAAAQTFTGSSTTVPALAFGTLVNSWPAGVPTLSGSAGSEAAHTHAVGTLVNAWPAGVPTFAGSSSTVVVNHLHTLATGTTATGNFSQVLGTVDTSSGGTGGTPTQTALGTLSSNPTAGGAASYTPVGTNAWPAGVPALSGSSAAGSSHLHSAGTLVNAWPVGVPTVSGSTATGALTPLGSNASSAVSGSTTSDSGGTPAGTNSAPSLSGSSEAVGAGTPSGTVSQPTFSGAGADNRSAFVKVIFCSKD